MACEPDVVIGSGAEALIAEGDALFQRFHPHLYKWLTSETPLQGEGIPLRYAKLHQQKWE